MKKLQFSQEAVVPADDFLRQMQASFGPLSKLVTIELQVTQAELTGNRLSTKIRYEIVGAGKGFFREQRIGYWLLDWEDLRLVRWRMGDETRSRAVEPFYSDVTFSAFGGNASYVGQLRHGADYWRTVLDGASGIDIYGHNGVSVGDINGSGLDSIYICQAAGLPNLLFRNKGDGSFEDITEGSGVGILENTACALFADFSNKGRQDLLVVRNNGPLLFENQGHGKFNRKPEAFHFAQPPQGTFTGASAGDYNRDGLLDVYFCLYSYYQGTDQYKYPTPYFAAENGPPNFLMCNNGDGTFRDVTAASGLGQNNTRYSFCCGWNDFDQDGWPDLYVVNDFGKKNLYRNNRDGTFADIAPSAGVEDVGAGMSVGWFDYNNDGSQDLYVANMWTSAGERIAGNPAFQQTAAETERELYRKHALGNSLLQNNLSEKRFEDVTDKSQTAIARWAWSSDAWDFDHDGFADIYVANGMISGPNREDLNSFFWREVVAKSPNTFRSDADYEQGWKAINELVRSDYSWSGYERNVFFANNRDGTFSDVSAVLGLDFIEDSRAFALADVDGDGRLEVLVKNRNAPQLRLMKNCVADLPASISFRLKGSKSNRDAIGASITIETSAGKQTKLLQAGSGFLSQHSKELFFGLGDAKGEISARIRWPAGEVQELKGLAANRRILVTEGETHRMEKFAAAKKVAGMAAQPGEILPMSFETWLLSPVLAPDAGAGVASVMTFRNAEDNDRAAVYNLVFRQIFDRHQDMTLPTSFLVNDRREIVKVYQGEVSAERFQKDMAEIPQNDAERLTRALPFRGETSTYEFRRNYLSLASVLFQRGYFAYSEDYFRAALKQDASSAEAFYGLGSVYLKQGRNQLARENFESAIRLTAAYPETTPNAWNNLGLLATRDGNTARAIVYFEEAIKADPNHFIALENLGNAYKQQKQWPEAKQYLGRALAVKPTDAEANYSLGMVFAQSDDVEQAAVYLGKALEVKPIYPEALNNLGVLYLRTRRRDEAVASFKKCIDVAPGFERAYLNLARVYSIEGRADQARTVLNSLLKAHPDSDAARQALAQLP